MMIVVSIRAMRWLSEDVELDEIECILANLIFQGKIKGYISHGKRHLILSKISPFPTAAVIKGSNVTVS